MGTFTQNHNIYNQKNNVVKSKGYLHFFLYPTFPSSKQMTILHMFFYKNNGVNGETFGNVLFLLFNLFLFLKVVSW